MNFRPNPRIALAGSVNSSLLTLRKLHEHNCNLTAVMGLDPSVSGMVSGYQDIKQVADSLGYDSLYFHKINEDNVYQFLKQKEVDLFFIVGLSQMVREPLLSMANVGNVGFHPTHLPIGRGRAAIPWMILKDIPGAATFFLLTEGMDDGPIIAQVPFTIDEKDYAQDVINKILKHIDAALDTLLPAIKEGKLNPINQDHNDALYLGIRKPTDGKIYWNVPAKTVHKLVRATSAPYPGAFTFYDDRKLIVERCRLDYGHIGVPGRIVAFEKGKPIIACTDGAIVVEEFRETVDIDFRIGKDFK